MILFLDVISPVPKFVITDNNKVIESLHILDRLDQNYTKVSDTILNKFLILQRKHNLLNLLDHLIVCTGPGSYTSLRVGISFMLGIRYSREIPIYGITCTELLSPFIMRKDFYKTLIIICSANNQNFLCLPFNHKNYLYKILKINDKYSFDNINLKLYSKCISNFKLPNFINNKICSNIKKLTYILLENTIHENFLKIISNEKVLQPIYISDNELFD